MAILYIVPTPVGNLEDMSFRAIEILKKADFVLAEDTRTSNNLFKHFGITTKLIAYHQHNEHHKLNQFVRAVNESKTAALISDAGTPGISDPGYLLIRECISTGIEVSCLPGPTAFVPALVMSGFPSDRFLFEGFLPHKKGRETKIKSWINEERTIVLYESPHRLLKCLQQMLNILGDERQAVVIREISKKFETCVRGNIASLLSHFEKEEPRGEIVIVIAGHDS